MSRGGQECGAPPLGWLGILRLGLVQAALGAVVVLVTSTLNRVMVVEYRLPAVLPGALVALHYAVQMIRPRFGHGSDLGGRRTPWIVGGMIALGAGGVLCACAAVRLAGGGAADWVLALAAYVLVGLGVGAAGTSLLALLATRVEAPRRAAAATLMWVLMILGFALTSASVGHFLDPFSPRRLLAVTAIVAAIAIAVTVCAVLGVEPSRRAAATSRSVAEAAPKRDFRTALESVWGDPQARSFTLFVFVSMLAYSAQELLLEPFAGLVYGYSVGSSARLSGLWHAAVLLGMVAVGIAGSGRRRFGSLRQWTTGGCLASAVALLGLAAGAAIGPGWPLRGLVAALGVANGVFAVSAIGAMMELSHVGSGAQAGMRMGLWGAAQALAFALGGVTGTGAVDLLRGFGGSPERAFGAVFVAEAALYLLASWFATRVNSTTRREAPSTRTVTA